MATYADSELDPLIDSVNQLSNRPVLIGIDGQGGAGKSTFAQEFVAKLDARAIVVQGDDFYRDMPEGERAALSPAEGFERYFDWQRLERQVLLPAKSGTHRLRYQKYDWNNSCMGDWVEVPVADIVIVEGVYTLRPALRDMWDVKIYVEAREEVRTRRQIERGENARDWIQRWAAAEDFYVARHDPQAAADWVFVGEC